MVTRPQPSEILASTLFKSIFAYPINMIFVYFASLAISWIDLGNVFLVLSKTVFGARTMIPVKLVHITILLISVVNVLSVFLPASVQMVSVKSVKKDSAYIQIKMGSVLSAMT